jgi:DNA repair protein RecN (Recombination protein N)
MLIRLALQNIAIIEALELEFQGGLNAITGETGSGKSLMLDAIQRVFEKKGSPKARGRIELTFDLQRIHNRAQVLVLLDEAGVELQPDDTELIIARELTATSSRARVNGYQVPLDLMERLGPLILEIYGQHDLHNLFSSARQRDLLDNIGGEPLLKVRQEARRAFRDLQKVQNTLETLRNQQLDRERQLDFLSFQVQEIAQAELSDIFEDQQLQAERDRLSHCENLRKVAFYAMQLLTTEENYESPSVFKLLGQLQKGFSPCQNIDPQFMRWSERVADVEDSLKTLMHELQHYGETLDTRPERINEIVDRLDVLDKLKRKYGGSLETVVKTATELEAQLDLLQQAETHLEQLETQLKQTEIRYSHLCKTLTELRQNIATSLESAISQELQVLMLPAAQFHIQLMPIEPTETGQDQITFMFSANPGEPVKPLARVASGGELSRLMLALKIRTAHADSLTTMILDEIDTGMSGVTVRAVVEKLQMLQHQCQIIVITHQPIVAAKAQWHLHIQKHLRPHGVEVHAVPLTNKAQRKAILSQLASGFTENDTVTARFIEQLLA